MLTISLIYGKCLGELYGLIVFILGVGPVLHHIIYFSSEKILNSCCKVARFLSPISSIGVACVGFAKNFLYQQLYLWWCLLLTRREFWLIVEKIDLVC